MLYGHDTTIHKTSDLDVEVDKDGKVVAVWFRCMSLPFTQSKASQNRAADMTRMYGERAMPSILAIEVEDTK